MIVFEKILVNLEFEGFQIIDEIWNNPPAGVEISAPPSDYGCTRTAFVTIDGSTLSLRRNQWAIKLPNGKWAGVTPKDLKALQEGKWTFLDTSIDITS